jgi:hypothetical protein
VRRNVGVGLVCALAVAFHGCQPLIEDIPDSNPVGNPNLQPTLPPPPAPGSTATPTDPPAPGPKPRKTATPTPKTPARTTPTPTKTATPRPGGGTATPTTAPGGGCFRSSPAYLAHFVAARDQVETQHPDYYSNAAKTCIKTGKKGGESYRDLFGKAIAANMNAMGLKAGLDPNDRAEIRVKANGVVAGAGFSEQYHYLYSNACIHDCPNCYRATCTPSWW